VTVQVNSQLLAAWLVRWKLLDIQIPIRSISKPFKKKAKNGYAIVISVFVRLGSIET
jgi:hypothetical protein